ncbi:MAG: ankyrin repeat domain-containing protein [Treponema sp.]|nr:ankyrin repeat domain-containing protein [Treponema sp.]
MFCSGSPCVLACTATYKHSAKDENGWTALMYAAERDAEDITELLLAAGMDMDTRNEDGKTALMIAEERGAKEMMELPKAAGAKTEEARGIL